VSIQCGPVIWGNYHKPSSNDHWWDYCWVELQTKQ